MAKRVTHPGSPIGEPLASSEPHDYGRRAYDPTELCAKAFRLALLAFVTAMLGMVPHGYQLAKWIASAPVEAASKVEAP